MVGIIGSGIAGLTAGFELEARGVDFEIIEASERPGGKIRSERVGGFLVEHGPNSLQTASPLLNRIIAECDLDKHRLFAHEAARKRYVVHRGELEALPMSPPALLKSGLFSLRSKLKLAAEPFVGSFEKESEESVAHFVRRRLGSEILDYAVDPFVTGIFAGDPEALSVKHAFPTLFTLEQEHGSLLKGLIVRKRGNQAMPGKRIFSFREGIGMLPDAIARRFDDRIQTGARVVAIHRQDARWRIDWVRGNTLETRIVDSVISTIPLPDLQSIHLDLQFDLEPLWNVSYPPVAVLAMGFNREDVAHPLDGFGMLVPARESTKRILGAIFSSTVFPGHAPAGKVLLTTLVGGARNADMALLSSEFLQDLVLDDLYDLLGVHGDPIVVRRITWERAIPQYNTGYGIVKALLNNIEAAHPGLVFAGNYRQGISVPDAMQSGVEAVGRLTG